MSMPLYFLTKLVFIIPTGSTTTSTSFYGNGQGPSYLVLYCLGSEKSILDCRHDKLQSVNCGDGDIAGIKCQGI